VIGQESVSINGLQGADLCAGLSGYELEQIAKVSRNVPIERINVTSCLKRLVVQMLHEGM